MADLLVDTDVFIDHLKGVERSPRRHSKLAYSIVTRELFAGPEHQLPVARRLLGSLEAIPVDRRIAERAGEIRRNAAVRLPDALIAATARTRAAAPDSQGDRRVAGLRPVEHDRDDFRRVAGLRLR